MFVLNIGVKDRSPITILKREFNRLRKETMREVAQEFLNKHVPPRFAAGNQQKYRHERRNPVYRRQIKPAEGVGAGKTVNLQLKGTSRRRALSMARITATSGGSKLRLRVPAYFTRPHVGAIRKKDGTTGRITRQPDKVRELKTITAAEKTALKKFARARMLRRIKALRGLRTKRLTA